MCQRGYPLQQAKAVFFNSFIFRHDQDFIEEGIDGGDEFDDDIEEFVYGQHLYLRQVQVQTLISRIGEKKIGVFQRPNDFKT